MNTKHVIYQKIVAVKQSRVRTSSGVTMAVAWLVLENGVRLMTHAHETETEVIGDLVVNEVGRVRP